MNAHDEIASHNTIVALHASESASSEAPREGDEIRSSVVSDAGNVITVRLVKTTTPLVT